MVYFRKFLTGLGVAPSGPSPCATDNQGARNLAYNPEHHRRSKHIARRHFYIRDMVEAMELTVPFVRTDDNIFDMLTKQLPSKDQAISHLACFDDERTQAESIV